MPQSDDPLLGWDPRSFICDDLRTRGASPSAARGRCLPALPVSLDQEPATALVYPMVRYPMLMRTGGFPVARYPDVRAAFPSPVTGRPEVARGRGCPINLDA